MSYMEHFGERAGDYSIFRPHYPDALFEFLKSHVNGYDLAWDCGTGNGQAAVMLAKFFKKVVATDLNQSQLDLAPTLSNIEYQCCSAENTTFSDHSVDLITIAQALHWFPLEKFYAEVKRVLKPKGLIAAWCYSLGNVSPQVDVIIQELCRQLPWPEGRRYIEEEYKTIPFPFKTILTPSFSTERVYSFEQFIGYLNTWSALKEEIKLTGNDPLKALLPRFEKAWGDLNAVRVMKWPIHMVVGGL